MAFFHHKTQSDWIKLEDAEIDELISEITKEYPNISLVKDQVAEFRNTLEAYKKTRKDILAQNLDHRSRHLKEAFVELQKKFSHINDEENKISEIHKYIQENTFFLWVQPRNSTEKYHFYLNKNQEFLIGRSNIPTLRNSVSRSALNITIDSINRVKLSYIGRFDAVLTLTTNPLKLLLIHLNKQL